MQTVLMPHAPAAHPAKTVPPFALPQSRGTETRKAGNKQLDSLLKTGARADVDVLGALEIEHTPGAFQGLRVAMLFNAAVCILGLIGYEAWTMMAH